MLVQLPILVPATRPAVDWVGLRGDHPALPEEGPGLPQRAERDVCVFHLRQARRFFLRGARPRGDHPALHRLGRRRERVDLLGDEG